MCISEKELKKRVIDVAVVYIANQYSVRDAARAISNSYKYNYTISKSTVHKYLKVYLPMYDPILSERAENILLNNTRRKTFK